MMVGRALELEPLAHLDERDCQPDRWSFGCGIWRGDLSCGMPRSKSVRARSLDLPDWSVPGVRSWRRPFLAWPRRSRGRLRLMVEQPIFLGRKMRWRLGIAYAPEDRQRQGLVVAMTVGENIGLTRIWQLMRGPFLDFQAEDRLAEEYIQILRIKTPDQSPDHSQPFRW